MSNAAVAGLENTASQNVQSSLQPITVHDQDVSHVPTLEDGKQNENSTSFFSDEPKRLFQNSSPIRNEKKSRKFDEIYNDQEKVFYKRK